MKILFYGDLQVNHNRTDYMKCLQGALGLLHQIILERRPDLVVNLGDLMDTKHIVSVDDLVWAFKWSRVIGHAAAQVNGHPTDRRHWILKGNHDISDKRGDFATVQVMEDEFTKVCMTHGLYAVDGKTFYVMPYTEDIEGLQESLKQAETADVKGIFGHVDWLGCRLTPTWTSKKGLDPAWVMERFPDTPVFNGHYHHPMSVGNVFFVGSPLHKDFNDILGEVERGFSLWDTEKGEIERIANRNTFYCMNLRYETEKQMKDSYAVLQPLAEQLRVKVSVPHKLVEEAKEMFGEFLWISIQPIESGQQGVYHTTQVSVTDSPSEIVKRGVESAPDQYDRKLLERMGAEAFK